MANVDAPDLGFQKPHSGTWGNLSAAHFTVDKAASNGDVYRLGVLPKGAKIFPMGLKAIVEDGDASTTLAIGIVAKNSGAQGDADYYAAAKSIATGPTSFGEADANKAVTPLVLDDDYYLIATLGGANQTTAIRIDAIVQYIFTGHE